MPSRNWASHTFAFSTFRPTWPRTGIRRTTRQRPEAQARNRNSSPFGKAIQRPEGPEVHLPARDRRRGPAAVAEIVDPHHFPLCAGADDGHLTLFTDRVDLSIRRHWRGKILAGRPWQA